MAAREGAAIAKQAGLNQLYASARHHARAASRELRGLTRARLLNRLAATRPATTTRPRAPRHAARPSSSRSPRPNLTLEERQLAREIDKLVRKLAPQLLDQPGIGTLLAAQVLLSWSHRGRLPTRPPSRGSPASHRSPPHPARRSATASTAAATASSTAPSTSSCSPENDHTPHDRLHRTATTRRQDPPRSNPLPQALPRPQPLPPTRERTATADLTNIEASLAHARALGSPNRAARQKAVVIEGSSKP